MQPLDLVTHHGAGVCPLQMKSLIRPLVDSSSAAGSGVRWLTQAVPVGVR